MKLRIQDNSIRFRITLRELEQLHSEGRLSSTTSSPSSKAEFQYGINVCADLAESHIDLHPFSIILNLTGADFAKLASPEQEGVYIRQEWQNESGKKCRFMAFVEKDRPGSACEKPEAWVYEEVPGRTRTVKPIPNKGGGRG